MWPSEFDRNGAVCISPIWIKLLLLNDHLAQKLTPNDSRMMVSIWNTEKLGLPLPLSKSNINRGNSLKSQWYKYKCKSYLCLVILIFHFLLYIWVQQLYYCQLSEACGKEEMVGIKCLYLLEQWEPWKWTFFYGLAGELLYPSVLPSICCCQQGNPTLKYTKNREIQWAASLKF